MSDSKKPHPLKELVKAIDEYNEKRMSFESKDLIDIRERISLNLFYLSDFISEQISDLDAAEYNRRRAYATKEEELRGSKDPDTNKKYTQKVIENKARIECESFDIDAVDAKRRREKMRIIVNSSNQILNAISSRLGLI